LSDYIFATTTRIDNRKNYLNGNISPTSTQYGEVRLTNGCYLLTSLRHPSKFERVSRLGFVTAATSLNGSQSNFARCLAVSWSGIHYIHSVPKTANCYLVITSANEHRFSQFFHYEILQEITDRSLVETSTSP